MQTFVLSLIEPSCCLYQDEYIATEKVDQSTVVFQKTDIEKYFRCQFKD